MWTLAGDVTTIEEKLSDDPLKDPLKKYVNNDGSVRQSLSTLERAIQRQMAKALIHFSFTHSNHNHAVFDIQGDGLEAHPP